jgi:nucleoside-diphosphate-sugar epimerase
LDVRGAFNVAADPGVARGIVAATWRTRIQPTPEGWVDLALQTPLLDRTRARTELGWTPARRAGDALLEVLEGFREGAGAATPPLRA